MLFQATRPQLKMARGFSLAEVLIAIVIITILTIGSLAVYSAQLGRARDTERMNDISRIKLYLGNFIGDYGEPPNTSLSSRRLKNNTDCKSDTSLFNCFVGLKVSTSEDLTEMFFDPLTGVNIPGETDTFKYLYGSDKNAYAICATLEDQSSAYINAAPSGQAFEDSGTRSTKQDNLACLYETPIGATQIKVVKPLDEPTSTTN